MRPVKVWMRTGTRVHRAAIIDRSPAFGVMEWTMSGRSFRKTRMSSNRDFRSLKGAIFRAMGTEMVRTFSRLRMLSSSGCGEERAMISYRDDRSRRRPRQNRSSESGTVAVRMIFFRPAIF